MASPKSCLLSFPTTIPQLCVALHQMEEGPPCPSSYPHFNNLLKIHAHFLPFGCTTEMLCCLDKGKINSTCGGATEEKSECFFPSSCLSSIHHATVSLLQMSVETFKTQTSASSLVSSSCGCKERQNTWIPEWILDFGWVCKSFFVITPFQTHHLS